MPDVPHPTGFMRQRWRGQAPLSTLFWRDMLAVGTVLNLLFGFAALMLAAQGLPVVWAAVLHFATVPWNAFLAVAVWRTPAATPLQRTVALGWLGVMLVV